MFRNFMIPKCALPFSYDVLFAFSTDFNSMRKSPLNCLNPILGLIVGQYYELPTAFNEYPILNNSNFKVFDIGTSFSIV